MNFVLRSSKLPAGKRPVHLWTMTQVLRALDVKHVGRKHACTKMSYRIHGTDGAFGLLCDLYDEAKANHRGMVLRWHPDRPGGNAERAAHANAVWAQCRKLMRRRGVAY